MQFTDLRIPIATRMQLVVSGADYKPHTFQSQLLGFRAQATVLVYFPKKPLLPLHNNSNVLVRVGLQSAIVRFDSMILEYQEHPFSYVHLTYPADVEIEQQLRRSPRFDLDSPIKVEIKTSESGYAVPGELLDISLNGARLSAAHHLPKVGSKIQLSTAAMIAGTLQNISLLAEIKSASLTKDIDPQSPSVYGLIFIDTPITQQLLLQALCYELQSLKLNFAADNT
jgi:c-di-GMP-binding flagellar brake protein YcgR